MTQYKTNLTKNELDEFLRKLQAEGHSMKTTEVTKEIYVAARVHYGGWKNALSKLGIIQEPNKQITAKRKHTPETMAEEFRAILARGYSKSQISKKYGALYNAILRQYGSIEHFAETVGIDLMQYKNIKIKTNYRKVDKVEYVEYGNLSKQDVDKFIDTLIATCKGDDDITAESIFANYPKEYVSIKKHYGKVSEAFVCSGKYILDKNVPKNWTKEFLVEQIKMGYEMGKPLNTAYVTIYASSAEEFARKAFGSWRQALETSGIPKEYYELDSQESARAGHEFENVLGEILSEIGVEYTKYDHDKYRPDFVVGTHWIDAKLSMWTIEMHKHGTIKNYEPHCDKLTLVFLRGSRDYDAKITEKTRLVSVYKIMKKLPKDKVDIYQRKLDAILDILKENAA